MKKCIVFICFIILTLVSQIGGFVFLLSRWLAKKINWDSKYKSTLTFVLLYLMITFLIIPFMASMLGREPIKNTEKINPATFATVLLNRNYVKPEMNILLSKLENRLERTGIQITYLDANFPFIDGFPLLPHLSHNDGKKLDLSLVYETKEGIISKEQKSNSGYGVFVAPLPQEQNQIRSCLEKGYFQYDYPKYLSFGSKNNNLLFSTKGTKLLIDGILELKNLEKLFIEPHLKTRLKINDSRVRYHGCRAVRHDDHIHIQLK